MVGHIYLFLLITLEEATKETNRNCTSNLVRELYLEQILLRPTLYKELDLFAGEISAMKLAAMTRTTIEKFKNDYKAYGLYTLIEWRLSSPAVDLDQNQIPHPNEYRTLISDDNIFKPKITHSMTENSENLAKHLMDILRLKSDTREDIQHETDNGSVGIMDFEIIEYTRQHDLPIFVSIDGSVNEDEIATTSISIVAPDIRTRTK